MNTLGNIFTQGLADTRSSFSQFLQETQTSWRKLPRSQTVLLCLCLLVIVAAFVLRANNLGFPNRMSFDEDHFVFNARNYIATCSDWNDHPPLGKLLMMVGMLGFGDTSIGWRAMPLCFGLQSIALVYFLAKHLFSSRWAGLFAATFLAADGLFICYSRTALLDGMLVCLMLWSALAIVCARTWRGTLLAGILIGLASCVKWSGITMLLPMLFAVRKLDRKNSVWLLGFAAVPLVHVLTWSFALWVTHNPDGVYEAIRQLLTHHLSRGNIVHPAMSKWYSWPLLAHPVVFRTDQQGFRLRVLSTIGNPVLWYGVTLAVGAASIGQLLAVLRILPKRVRGPAALRARTIPFLLACWAAPFLPWIFSDRDSYIWHYMPSYAFGLVLLGGVVSWGLQRNRKLAFGFLALAFLAFLAFSPLSAQLPISQAYLDQLTPFESWK